MSTPAIKTSSGNTTSSLLDFGSATVQTPTMPKPKPSAAEQAAEINSLELFPQKDAKRRTDDLLRTMLETPPKPFTPNARAKPTKRSK
jgi:3-oxoacyl-(acyl-carrier-protein) synthase